MKTKYISVKGHPHIYYYHNDKNKLYRARQKKTINGQVLDFVKNGFSTIKEAETWLNKQISEANDLNITDPTKFTVKSYWRLYYKEKIGSGDWTADSTAQMERVFRLHILPRFGNTKLREVNRMSYRAYLNELRNTKKEDSTPKYSKAMLGNIHKALSALINDAIYNGILISNPLKQIELRSQKQARSKQISHAEYNKVLSWATDNLNGIKLAMFLLPTMGMRHGEVMGVMFKSIEEQSDGTMYLNITRARTQNAPQGKSTKNSYSVRRIKAFTSCAVVLREALRISKLRYKNNNKLPSPDDFIFVSDKARPYDYSRLTYLYRDVSKATGIHVYPHLFRHAFATFANEMRGELNPRDVSNYLGHKNISMTDQYNAGTDDGKDKVIDLMDSKVFRKKA
ncbi:tyrosine-type recombinase/integrase [Loigolactobacillus backii]|uniref:tyrosine-type recombinase/integrase n=1 Tax=Loigolactobacillus backii TaxID=375175 RepID=UPI0007F08FD5|nr:site-specific integrase [Loigolactobacillus backii]ANK66557.1 hypothetical protein AYR55_01920 [Loigolactobacillus backii]PIO87268.1 hypothetical protein B8A32_09070 [Loigolactobacillus backii]